jgi:5-methylcytosine-specific restriction endonuclease McrA
MADTLVLDPAGIPVSLMNWKDAVTLWCKDRAIIVESDEDRILRSQNFEMGMPIVIQLRNGFSRKMRREVPFSRKNIAIRDRSSCQYCSKLLKTQEYTYDHVMPRSRGGVSSWKNMVIACIRCNTKKANRTPEEAGMYLLSKPVKPSPMDKRFNFKLSIRKLKPQWKPWESYLYWNLILDET